MSLNYKPMLFLHQNPNRIKILYSTVTHAYNRRQTSGKPPFKTCFWSVDGRVAYLLFRLGVKMDIPIVNYSNRNSISLK